ncbi:MAG TPA: VWA domain-containing protein [Thermoanaerobaculia bacterium]|jgi:Ca-activated chloride channel family protein|nr:VWA domain-containing protein [Thermoanaerobaculia bacterium]
MQRHTVLAVCLLASSLAACGGSPAGEPVAGSGNSRPAASSEGTVNLLFTYGSEKEEWVKAVTARFNQQGAKTAGGKVVHVEAVPQGSGEMIDDLLDGTRKAHLASPASAVFLQLGNAKSRTRTGKDLIGPTQNLVISPVVIAMWKPMSEAIGWGKERVGWSNVLALARDPKGWAAYGHPEWGAFKLGHTHPETSNSGVAALLAEVYAGAGKVAGLKLADVEKPQTVSMVTGIESAIVHYGSSTGFFGKRLFSDGPQYLSAAVLYENMVIESYGPQYKLPFPVVAIYPKEGTFWSDHPVGIVEREWVTPEHREAAKIYIDYLLAKPQQEEALRFGFRPAAVEVPLAAPVDAAHGVDPREPQTTLEVPPAEVIDAVLRLWHEHKKRADITLVLDISGSMNEDGKIENAKAGAAQLLTLLDPEDRFSFLPFNAQTAWAGEGLRLADARDKLKGTVSGVFANGGTALYDAIAEAYDHAMARREPGRIAAIVVLSDGADTHSHLKLRELVDKLRTSGESGEGVRVFTIGYGKDAERSVLESIAEATRGRYYEGTPANIRTVFREISTFF